MLQSEVINKLSHECCLAMGSFDYFRTVRIYIQMALAVGVEHYRIDMDEVVALDMEGVEAGRFKSIQEAADKIGIIQSAIVNNLSGRSASAGGLKWMKVKDYELVPREPEKGLTIIPLK
jgi:hypothetical protein